MTNDGSNTLVYDAENRTLSATNGSTSGSYTYDGNNLRVKRVSGSTTTAYLFSGSKVVAEYVNSAAPTAPTREYIYSGSALLAKIEAGATKYYHRDHLSNRMVTDSSGNVFAQIGHYPYGESWYNPTNDKLIFTSYERDSESGNDYAMARYNESRLGRFSSPDALSGNISDPQSLNRFAYVLNDPCNLNDPLGLAPPQCEFHITFTGLGILGKDTSKLQAAESEINRILGANNSGLSAVFNSGSPDFTARLENWSDWTVLRHFITKSDSKTNGANDNWSGSPDNSAFIWVNNIQNNLPNLDTGVAIGRVTAHEFGHWALQIVHDYTTTTGRHDGGPQEIGIMGQGFDPINFGLSFDRSQVPKLQDLCAERRKKRAGGRSGTFFGGGGGGGGSWIWLLLLPPVEVVTVKML